MSTRTPVVFNHDEGRWLNWLGHPVRYLATGSDTDETYCLSQATVGHGGEAPPHRHNFDEGFYVLDGEITFTAGNRSVRLKAGEMIHISSRVAHKPKVEGESATLLTLAAPSGFDRFQFEAGEELASVDAPAQKTKDEILAAIDNISRNYEIEMHPPAEAFLIDPQIHISGKNDGVIVDVVGDRYRFLMEGEHTSGRYALWHARISPGGGPPPHTHSREEEGFYVLSGELLFEADGKQSTGKAETFVNLPAGSRHRFSNPNTEEAEALIFVAPAGLEKMFRRTGQIVTDPASPIALVTTEEKKQLAEIAPEFGVTLG